MRYEERLFGFGVLASQGYAEASWCWRRLAGEGGGVRTTDDSGRTSWSIVAGR